MHVPEGWKLSTVGSLANTVMGYAFKSSDFEPYGIPLIRMGNLYQNQLQLNRSPIYLPEKFLRDYDRFIINPGDLVMSMTGTMGKRDYGFTVQIPEKTPTCLLNQRVMKLVPNKFTSRVFLLNLLRSEFILSKLYSFPGGTKQANLSSNQVTELPALIPPLPEQQKIAQILSTWDKAIEKQAALIAAKQKRKKALMQQLLTGKKRFAEFVKTDDMQKTKFGTIPYDWQYLHIAEVAKQLSVKNHAGHDLPVLSCTKHYGLVDSLAYFGRQIFSEDTSTYKVAPRNTFAYATNHIEEGSIGYQNLYDEALISPMYTVFQTKKNINDEFLYRVLKTELYRHIFEVNTSASVDRRGSLRWNQFAAIKIPVPSIPEQQKIASFFAVADKEIETNQRQLSALKEQKKGLMQQLLTGKRRVIA